MKLLVITLLFAFCIFANGQSVLDLNKDTFESTIKDNEFVLNMFYAPWCGHCKTLKPVFDEVATQVGGKYVIAKVDCTVENDLCSQHNVRGYPTVAFFKNGNKKEFDGPRTTEGIISWLDKKSGPIAVELTTAESIKEFSNSNNVVAYSSQKNDAFKAYLVAAEDSRLAEMKFAYVSDSALFNGNVDGSVVYFTKDGQQVVPEENLATAELLATFLFDSTFPVFQEIDASNFKNYASRGKKLLLAWIKTKGENAQQEIDVISKFATQYTQFSFGYISHENFGPNMDRMGASGKVVPAITLLSFTDNKPIVFEGEWNEENIQEWIEGVISGKYKYASKSEAVPETQGNVVTLVGKNFDEIVHDTTKDVLVEFYAPWCGHCKNLVPEYEKLGELFSKVDDVVIGKIDLTANDVDTAHFDVKGFPTILLYKRDAKATPLQFQGARDAKSIAAWIKDNSASEAVKLISHDEL